MMVVLFHLYDSTPVASILADRVPALIDGVLKLGFLGVYLFFVISGYVISLTLYRRMSSFGEGLRFFVRRQLRLDPPYWIAIAISVASALAINSLRPETHSPVPSLLTILAHLVYLQDLLHLQAIAGVFWTLCFEIQFYLFFVAVIVIAAKLRLSLHVLGWWMLPVYLLSIANWWNLVPITENFALTLWFAFFLGVVVFMYGRGEFSRLQLGLYFSIPLALLIADPPTINGIAEVSVVTTLLTALVFLLAQVGGGIRSWLSGSVLSYLGTISYSLYLMHAIIGIRLLKLILRPDAPPGQAVVLYLAVVLVSIVAADGVYRFVERPSQRLSKRLSWR